MNELTPMQDLLEDLKETKITSINALDDIEDVFLKESCQSIVIKTLNCIINRIETELLPKEQQVIEDAFIDGYCNDENSNIESHNYYNTKFKNNEK